MGLYKAQGSNRTSYVTFLLNNKCIFKSIYLIFVLHVMSILPVSVYIHHMLAWCLPKAADNVRCPGNGIMDEGELPCEFKELKLCPFEEQQVLLTNGQLRHP